MLEVCDSSLCSSPALVCWIWTTSTFDNNMTLYFTESFYISHWWLQSCPSIHFNSIPMALPSLICHWFIIYIYYINDNIYITDWLSINILYQLLYIYIIDCLSIKILKAISGLKSFAFSDTSIQKGQNKDVNLSYSPWHELRCHLLTHVGTDGPGS